MFDQLPAPAQLWVFADQPLRHPGQAVYVEANRAGPNGATVALKRKWYES